MAIFCLFPDFLEHLSLISVVQNLFSEAPKQLFSFFVSKVPSNKMRSWILTPVLQSWMSNFIFSSRFICITNLTHYLHVFLTLLCWESKVSRSEIKTFFSEHWLVKRWCSHHLLINQCTIVLSGLSYFLFFWGLNFIFYFFILQVYKCQEQLHLVLVNYIIF